jgi:hypothetical protein
VAATPPPAVLYLRRHWASARVPRLLRPGGLRLEQAGLRSDVAAEAMAGGGYCAGAGLGRAGRVQMVLIACRDHLRPLSCGRLEPLAAGLLVQRHSAHLPIAEHVHVQAVARITLRGLTNRDDGASPDLRDREAVTCRCGSSGPPSCCRRHAGARVRDGARGLLAGDGRPPCWCS